MDSIVALGLITMGILVTAGVLGAALLYWGYRATPIAELRDIYSYRPRAAVKGYTRRTGLKSPDLCPFEQLPAILIVTLLQHEDDLFFCHRGFNWREIGHRIRAFVRTGKLRGGSGITQQLAKNLRNDLVTNIKLVRVARKVRETGATLALERNFTKTEILSLYLDTVRLGPGRIHGIREAARAYFGRAPSELSLEQIFFIVGILPRPAAIVTSLSRQGGRNDFRYRQAWIKFMDLYRFVIARRGWHALDTLETLPLHEAVSWMRCYASYVPRGMANELELALGARATRATERLRLVVESVAAARAASLLGETNRA
jgi:membrane peptidoglycan carboxypeptidase